MNHVGTRSGASLILGFTATEHVQQTTPLPMLHPGKHDQTTGTMAQAMETAFLNQWPHFNGDLPVPTGKQLAAMRLFFVAVAQGVVQHLRDHPEAFHVTTASAGSGGGSHTHPAEMASISVTGTTA